MYEPCNGPENIFGKKLVGELASSNCFTHKVIAADVFSRYLFAISLRKYHKSSIVKALVQIFTQHAEVPQKILFDSWSAFTSKVRKEHVDTASIKLQYVELKHVQAIVSTEGSHQKLEQKLKIRFAKASPQWDRYINLAVIAHNTTY